MKEWAKWFYRSKAWQTVRKLYLSNVNGLCERCLKKDKYIPAKIVHHKTYITPNNIDDCNVTLNLDNLEALCQDCHNYEHHGKYDSVREDVSFDRYGNLVMKNND